MTFGWCRQVSKRCELPDGMCAWFLKVLQFIREVGYLGCLR